MPIEQFWEFYSFLDKGACVIQSWMIGRGLDIKAITKIETRFRYLSFVKTWEPNFAKKLTGYDDIWEIRISHQKNAFRPLGCFGPKKSTFTLLIGAEEKDWKFEPRNAPEIAMQRRQLILNDRSLLYEYEPFLQIEKGDEK